MLLDFLATEILAEVYFACDSVDDVLSLSSTCHRLRNVYQSSRKLWILQSACEAQYGPFQDAVQLVTHNASQPPHIARSVPLSQSLLKQVIDVGRVAKRWEVEVYPFKRWKDDYEDRRMLGSAEGFRVRRALYRSWLYAAAFHNPSHPRYSRSQPLVVRERAQLLQNWANDELAEIEDVRQIVRETLRSNVCPSNGTIQRKFRKRFPETNHQLLFNVHLNYPPPGSVQPRFYRDSHMDHSYHKYRPTAWHEPGLEGWGDDVQHYYIIEDMMKLDPKQILLLKDNAPYKHDVEQYVKELGPWFENNGETFGQTMEYVLAARGEDVGEFIADVKDGVMGIVKEDEV